MPRTNEDDKMIDRVLEREGGFVDNPFDKGGPTNKGITLETYANYLGKLSEQVTLAEIRDLTTEKARDIYYDMYIVRPGFDKINGLLRELLFDAGVNHGPSNAIKMVQRAYNRLQLPDVEPTLVVDGVLGPKSIAALNDPNITMALLWCQVAQRLRFYGNIVARNPQQQRFAAGWLNRVADLMDDLA